MTTATRKQPGPNASPRRISQAFATDPVLALHLAETFQPDIDLIVSEGTVTFGVKGAGKSNFCALLFEQIARYPIPTLLFDTKGEYRSLIHAGLAVLATANACPSGHDILSKSMRVVVDLRSWDSDEAAALAMCQLLRELFAYASAQDDPECRIPCPLLLDEAQYWLPQSAVSYLGKETAKELRDCWHSISIWIATWSLFVLRTQLLQRRRRSVALGQAVPLWYCQMDRSSVSPSANVVPSIPALLQP